MKTMPNALRGLGWPHGGRPWLFAADAWRDVPAVRVGIGHGSVVVGDLIREGQRRKQSPLGIAPQLAAQCSAGRAEPVGDGELTYRLARRGPSPPSRWACMRSRARQPVTVWTLIGERMVESRFDARRERKRRQWWAETGAGFAEAALASGFAA